MTVENPLATTAAPSRRKSAPATIGGWNKPTNIEEAWRIAKWLAASEIVPKNFRRKPEEVMAAMMTGQDMGLNTTQALNGIAVIGGRAAAFGTTMAAIIKSHPVFREEKIEMVGGGEEVLALHKDEWPDAFGFKVSILRTDSDQWTSSVYLVGMAKSAIQETYKGPVSLWGKPGPWQANPQAMLRHRAFQDCARMAVPEAYAGLYTVEEVRDFDYIDVAHTTVETKPKPAAQKPVLTVVPPVVAAPVAESEPAPKSESEPAPKSESDASEEFAPPISLAPETAAVVAETAETTLKHNMDAGMVAVLRTICRKVQESMGITEVSCETVLEYVRNQGYSPDGEATETLRCLLFHFWFQYSSRWEWKWPVNGIIPANDAESVRIAGVYARAQIDENFPAYSTHFKRAPAPSTGDTQ